MFTKTKFLCISASFLICTVANGAATNAEYAIRWKIVKDVPGTIDEVSKLLKLDDFEAKDSHHSIHYFDITPPKDAPKGYQVIARNRVTTKENGKTENQITFKYRNSTEIDTAINPATWLCPLGTSANADEIKAKLSTKYEVDISFSSETNSCDRYSLSCTLEGGKKQLDFPAALAAKEKIAGKVSMKRRKIENITLDGISIPELKIEEWQMTSPESTLIEVSMPGANSAADRAKFVTLVVKKLLAAKITPSVENKTPTE